MRKDDLAIEILLVEDEPGDAAWIRRGLSRSWPESYDVTWVQTLAEGQQSMAGGNIDLILLDVSLPDSCGLATVDACCQAAGSIPVVVLTGHVDQEFALSTLDAGARDYLIKGEFDDKLLIRSLRYAMARARAERALIEESEAKRILLDNIQTQVWYLTNEYTYGAVNKAHAEFNGVRIEDLAYQNMYDIFPGEIVEVCRRSNKEVFATAGTVRTEEWVPRASGEERLISIVKSPKLRSDGRVEYVVCSAEDITEQKKAGEALAWRLDFEKMVSGITANFVSLPPGRLDDGINNVLKTTGEFFDIDRSYLFMISGNGQEMSNTHEWCAAGIEPAIHLLQNISINSLHWWFEQIRKKDYIYAFDVNNLPEEAAAEKKHWKRQNIKSLLCIPMYGKTKEKEESLIGFFGFDSVKKSRSWDLEQITLLQVIAGILVNAIEKYKSENILKAYEEERERIARELHDEVGQSLLSMKLDARHLMELNGIIDSKAAQEYGKTIKRLNSTVDETIEGIRECIFNLMPYQVGEKAFAEIIMEKGKEFQSRFSISTEVICEQEIGDVSIEIQSALYRCLQEALNNIVKHSEATKVEICLRRAHDKLNLLIKDNGVGFAYLQPESTGKKYGLRVIRERVEVQGGSVRIITAPGRGVEITIQIPAWNNA